VKHEGEIDRNLLELRVRAIDIVALYWQKAATFSQSTFFDVLQYVASQSNRPRHAAAPVCKFFFFEDFIANFNQYF
jgi:receptor expression-enhancing protein 1/2/3/4